MKILVVCQYYYPEQFRINDICEQLVEDGYSVTVLTGLPNYPKGNVPTEYRRGRKRKETINGVKVQRSYEIGRKNGVVGLALNYVSYMVSASFKALFQNIDFDIIFIYQLSPVTMALPGIVLKKRSGRPVYLYCCDIWPESMKNILPDENGYLYKVVKRISRYIYSQCDAISVTSKPFIQYFNQEHSIPFEKITYIPQHAEDMPTHLNSSSTDDIINFVFMGNIGIAQDIDCILDAADRLKQIPKFKIHFVGDGSYLEKSKMIANTKGLIDIVMFHGRHPLERMQDFYNMADACIITLKDENLTGLTMPSKLQGYMSAGKVVIGAINGAAQEVIKESRCGLCVNAGDSKALAEAMKDFIEYPVKYSSFGENGREYYEKHFTKEIYMEKLETELNRLVEA